MESRVEKSNLEHPRQMLLGVGSSEYVVDWKLDVRENHLCHRIGSSCGSIDGCPMQQIELALRPQYPFNPNIP